MIFFIIWILCGIVAAMIGSNKGLGCFGAILGFIFGPFGILIVFFMTGDRIHCPFCKELVNYKAVVCPHCQRNIKPLLSENPPVISINSNNKNIDNIDSSPIKKTVLKDIMLYYTSNVSSVKGTLCSGDIIELIEEKNGIYNVKINNELNEGWVRSYDIKCNTI